MADKKPVRMTVLFSGDDLALKEEMDEHLRQTYPEDWYQRRSEFARDAIREKIERERGGRNDNDR